MRTLGTVASHHVVPASFKTALGGNVGTSSSTTLVITTTAAITIGDLVVVRVASDNLNATTPTFTCADSGGNTYTRHIGGAVNASAALGVAGAILCSLATVAVNTGGTITITLSGAVAHKAAFAESYTSVKNTVRQAAAAATGLSTAPSTAAAASTLAGDLVLGTIAWESRGAFTGDSDTVNGTWSTAVTLPSATSGSDTTCVQIAGQYKVPNADGSQTYNATTVSTDWVAMMCVLQR